LYKQISIFRIFCLIACINGVKEDSENGNLFIQVFEQIKSIGNFIKDNDNIPEEYVDIFAIALVDC
jgi:hypothetical protein